MGKSSRIGGVSVLLTMVGLLAGGCGSDADDLLYKWSCSCGEACAKTVEQARSQTTCSAFGQTTSCTPTGDTCVCPGGDDSCEISIQ